MTKKMRAIVLAILLMLLAGTCVALFVPPKTEQPTIEEPAVDPFSFSIAYRSIVDGEEWAFDDRQWIDGKSYPTYYDTRTWTGVDDLRAVVVLETGAGYTKELAFQGWFLDEACTQTFDGVINAGTTGTIVLYAKSTVETWVGPY